MGISSLIRVGRFSKKCCNASTQDIPTEVDFEVFDEQVTYCESSGIKNR